MRIEWGIWTMAHPDVNTNCNALYMHPVFAIAAFHPHRGKILCMEPCSDYTCWSHRRLLLLPSLIFSLIAWVPVIFVSPFRFLSSLALFVCSFASASAFFMPIISSLVSILCPVSFFSSAWLCQQSSSSWNRNSSVVRPSFKSHEWPSKVKFKVTHILKPYIS